MSQKAHAAPSSICQSKYFTTATNHHHRTASAFTTLANGPPNYFVPSANHSNNPFNDGITVGTPVVPKRKHSR
jgi:hypothetical protein